MQTAYEEPSYDRLRNEAIQRLEIEDNETMCYQGAIEAKIHELKAQYRDEWDHRDGRIVYGVCFSSVLGNLINNNALYDKVNKESRYNIGGKSGTTQAIIDSSVIRRFADAHDKDIYISALEDAPVDWVELNEDAIKFLETCKEVI